MRELMIIPIIHAASDLGTLQEPIERVKLGLVGGQIASLSRASINDFWNGLKVGLENWQFDFSNLLVFQDALPVGPLEGDPIEPKIVRELAEKGSVNHQLIEWLIQKGAKLVGTENPELLVKEYQLVQRFLNLRLGDDADSDAKELDIANQQSEILVKRDHYIAVRIDKILMAPKVGLVFLGMLHRLEDHLPNDIQVCYPFGKPSKSKTTETHHVKR